MLNYLKMLMKSNEHKQSRILGKILKLCYCLVILFLMLYVLSWHLGIGWDIALEILLLCFLAAAFSDQTESSKPHKNVKDMTGIEFEGYCAEMLIQNGFCRVIVTPLSGDYGADIVAYDKQGCKWVFQCKRFKNKVGNTAVQEVVAAKAHYQAEYSAVMTNSVLTDGARRLARENNVVLYEKVD